MEEKREKNSAITIRSKRRQKEIERTNKTA